MKIKYEMLEGEGGYVTPIKVADALISDDYYTEEDLNEIADHLRAYTRNCMIKKNKERHHRYACDGDE